MTTDDEIPEDEREKNLEEEEERDEGQEGEEGKEGEGKEGRGEGEGTGGLDHHTVSPEALSFLSRVGATMEQISRVLSQWVYLKGEALTRALNDFARDIARASSQPQVEFQGKDVSIITTFFRYITGRERNPHMGPKGDMRPRGGPR
jgi:hypothetical protein